MSSEQIRKRRANEAALLRALHFSGMLQRGELSEQLGMRKSSVSSIVAEFVERGVLTEDRPGAMRSRVSVVSSFTSALLLPHFTSYVNKLLLIKPKEPVSNFERGDKV